jgi:hypothetical protein
MSSLVSGDCGMMPCDRAKALWRIFDERVEPFVKIIFWCDKKDIYARSTSMDLQPQQSSTEKALVAAIYYTSANCLTDEDCWALLGLARSSLLNERQAESEKGLLSTNIFCMCDINTIKAVLFYIVGHQRIRTRQVH